MPRKQEKRAADPLNGMTIQTDPEVWLDDARSDPFSASLTSFRLTLDGLSKLLDSVPKEEPDWPVRLHETVLGALAAASLEIAEDELHSLATNIEELHHNFHREVIKGADLTGGLRAVRKVPRRDSEAGLSVTMIAALPVDDELAVQMLREPLVGLVAPYTLVGSDARVAAAEVGLNIALARSTTDIQLEALLVSAVSSFESFLTGMAEVIVALQPSLLRASKVTFNALDVLDAEDRGDLVDRVRREFLNGHTRSFDALSKFFGQVISVESQIVGLREIVETRNVLVHHGGVVTRQYLNSCPESAYTEGDKIHVGESYLADGLRRLGETALLIVNESRSTFALPDADSHDDDAQINDAHSMLTDAGS